ncbi:MAG TPA: preprotein translocase subunit YajC [Pseudogracilibacillus sp.]|nr:preprotein translocase subunit YajC [Pseudogracilibacillus sp.]
MENFWSNVFASSIALIILIILIILIYFLINLRGVKKRKEHFSNLHQSLKKGQKVMFSNGIYGTIVEVKKDIVEIKVKSGTLMEVSRYSISEIIK